MPEKMGILEIEGLEVGYRVDGELVTAVDGIDLSVDGAETIGLVGESGCGKSTVIKSIMGILDNNGEIIDGSVFLDGTDISELSESELNARIRWSEISYVPQDAMAALNPVYQLGTQIVEVIRAHTGQSKSAAFERAEELVLQVGLDTERLYDYPHELSGGQRQRGVIALALALEPSVILADEPTTGLDVVVQDEILQLLDDIQADVGCAIVLVTHDMSVVADIADKTAVMYGGRMMEIGRTTEVFKQSSHPYTIGLKNAFPTLARASEQTRLINIPGAPPDLRSPPSGCRFSNRCPFATDLCIDLEPPIESVGDGHLAKCHYTDQATDFRERGSTPAAWLGEEETG